MLFCIHLSEVIRTLPCRLPQSGLSLRQSQKSNIHRHKVWQSVCQWNGHHKTSCTTMPEVCPGCILFCWQINCPFSVTGFAICKCFWKYWHAEPQLYSRSCDSPLQCYCCGLWSKTIPVSCIKQRIFDIWCLVNLVDEDKVLYTTPTPQNNNFNSMWLHSY